MKRFSSAALALVFLLGAGCSDDKAGARAELKLVSADGLGRDIGWVTFTNTGNGLEVRTDLQGLPPGQHGFHVHQNPDCSPAEDKGTIKAAQAAGGHYDPSSTGKHEGPGGAGHRGDLPVLTVAPDGTAKVAMAVPGVKAEEFVNRSIIIHAGGDNYSDMPQELGGGGARIACGVIK